MSGEIYAFRSGGRWERVPDVVEWDSDLDDVLARAGWVLDLRFGGPSYNVEAAAQES